LRFAARRAFSRSEVAVFSADSASPVLREVDGESDESLLDAGAEDSADSAALVVCGTESPACDSVSVGAEELPTDSRTGLL